MGFCVLTNGELLESRLILRIADVYPRIIIFVDELVEFESLSVFELYDEVVESFV